MDTPVFLLQSKLKEIEDFRKKRGQRYRLYNLLSIFILAVLSGADDFEAIAEFAIRKKQYLINRGLLDGKYYPSHDVFRWILQKLDRTSFAKLLSIWLETSIDQTDLTNTETNTESSNHAEQKAEKTIQLSETDLKVADQITETSKKMLHIDGKSLRATRTAEHSRTALQIVTAYCSDTQISIGQLIIDKKSCEKTAIPQLLNLLDLKDTITTIDAIATSKKNAATIVDKEGDYVLALKKNNKLFYLEVESFFKTFQGTSLIADWSQSVDNKVHGRTEVRTCTIISDLQYFPDAQDWKKLKSIVCIEAQRTNGNKTSLEKRFYLSSLEPNAEKLQEAIRRHWTVENELHWSLDVAFNEDKSRLKDKNAAANFAAIRRFALAVLKNAKISEHSAKTQRLQAAWDDEFLDKFFIMFQKNILKI